jgi:hypothetical protein
MNILIYSVTVCDGLISCNDHIIYSAVLLPTFLSTYLALFDGNLFSPDIISHELSISTAYLQHLHDSAFELLTGRTGQLVDHDEVMGPHSRHSRRKHLLVKNGR